MSLLEDSPNASNACGLRAQSSRRNETKPWMGASGSAAAIYSMHFLSSVFCERSRNCRFLAYLGSDRRN